MNQKKLINIDKALNQESTIKIMKKHTQVYIHKMNYDVCDFIPSEISGTRANDVHHICNRGIGGSKNSDYIENLMALSRDEHEKLGDKNKIIPFLYAYHLIFMKKNNIPYDFNNIPDMYKDEVSCLIGFKEKVITHLKLKLL
jgi:hypothetical protein